MIRCCSKLLVPRTLPTRNLIFINRCYASDKCKAPLIPKRMKRIFYTATGLAVVGIAGTVIYAKYDPEFRGQLDHYVPGSDKFISFVYQENGEISFEKIKDQIVNLPNEIYILFTEATEGITQLIKKDVPSIGPATKSEASPKDSKGEEAEKADGNQESSVLKIGDEAASVYKEAIKLIEDKDNSIPDLIDKAVEENDLKLWTNIRKQLNEESKIIEDVGKLEKQAEELNKKYLAEKRNLMSRTKLTDDIIKQFNLAEKELNDLKSELERLKALKLEAERNFFNKVEAGRKHFMEELNALFPGIKLAEKDLKVTESEIDLFLYYAVQKMNYYQKEIAKLESQALEKLRKLVEGNPSLQEVIDGEVSKARRQIKEDFDNKVLDLKSSCEKDLHEQMKRQEQIHIDLLNEQLALKEREVERKLLQRVEEQIQAEKNKQTEELAEMASRMQALNEAISKKALQDMKAQTSQGLWSAAEALYNKLKKSDNDQAASEVEPKPLAENIEAIQKAAAKGDDLVETVLATISETARDRGVYPEDTLRERFLNVESVAWRVAGIPEGGASLPMLLLAWVQSKLILRSSEPIPMNELKNEPIDPCSLSNYDVLQRSRYWVDRGDFEQALKYMNLLKGGARSVSLDWMNEVTLLLEAQQAANLLLAHASASGMIYS